jgi:hypothetical protein
MIPKEAKVGMKIFQITYFMANRNIAEWTINKIEEHKVRLVDKKGRRTTMRLADLWKWDISLKDAIDTAIENNQEGIKEAKSNIKAQEGEVEELRKMKRGLI